MGHLRIQDWMAWLVAFVRTPGRPLEFLRYSAISGLSLGLDIAVFVALTWMAVTGAALAGALSCMAGLVLHYALSVTLVFDAAATGKSHGRLIAEYALTGVMGFVITISAIFFVTDVAGAPAIIGKLVGVGLTFVSVYLVRSGVVFAPKGGVLAP
jgi:putative flippase GtrA